MTNTPRRPNILLILADQFAAHALSPEHSHTPHLDELAGAAAVFERAYVSFPLCVPSRASLVSGRMPHRARIEGNAPKPDRPAVWASPESLGHVMRAAGYRTAYAGKWHAVEASAPDDAGFEVIHPFGDVGLVDACAEFLSRGDDAPYLLIASFDDPHTICEYARGQMMPYGDVACSDVRDAPPLPANHAVAPYAPEALDVEKRAAARMYGTCDYDADDWRHYRHVYRSLVERTDAHVGDLLAHVDARVDRADTVVLFSSDHGDGDASHQWNQKTALHEECVRVPLIVAGPGVSPGTRTMPVSASIDLLPTLCAIAGVAAPRGAEGRAWDLGGSESEHDSAPVDVVVQTAFEHGAAGPRTLGRSLVRGAHRYTVYSWGRHREQLHDVVADPGQMRNLAVESAYDDVLEEMRAALLEWCLRHDDTAFLKKLVPPARIDPAVRAAVFATPY